MNDLLQADATLVLVAVSLLLSAASILLRKPAEPPINNDDTPDQLASRGSYIPLVIGRHRVGAVVGWVQPDDSVTTLTSSPEATGKGTGGQPSPQTFSESATHFLCVGPGAALHGIYQNGKRIFGGTITPVSHPSGSSIITNGQGTFRIYWGFTDDLVSSMMGNAVNHGSIPGYPITFSTRYPCVMRVEWDKKELGGTPQWPRLQYEVEVHPMSSSVSKSRALMVNKASFNEPVYPTTAPLAGQTVDVRVLYVENNGLTFYPPEEITEVWLCDQSPGVPPSTIHLGFDFSPFFQAGAVVHLHGLGNHTIYGMPGGPYWPANVGSFGGDAATGAGVRYWIVHSEYDSGLVPIPGTALYARGVTKLKLQWLVSGITFEGSEPTPPATFNARAMSTVETDGVNPAHLLDQLLFAPFPWGASLKRDHFDLNSLEDIGIRLGVTGDPLETVRCNMVFKDGQDAQAAIAGILQDLGCFISWCADIGRYRFVLIREELYDVPSIPADLILDPLPEVETVHDEKPADHAVFAYAARVNNYRELTVSVSDDAQASLAEHSNAQRIPVTVCTDQVTASNIGLRRHQEVVVEPTRVKLALQRDAALIYPGMPMQVGSIGVDAQLRVSTVKRDVLSSRVETESLVDHYGIGLVGGAVDAGGGVDGSDPLVPRAEDELLDKESDWFSVKRQGGLPANTQKISPSALFAAFELPRMLSDGKTMRLLVAHIRSGGNVLGAAIWASRDEAIYEQIGSDNSFWAGGVLAEALPADGPMSSPSGDGPLVSQFGPDTLGIENLEDAGMEEAWLAGRQVMILGTGPTAEICFLRSIDAVSSTQFRPKAFLRARYGTQRRAWPAGTPVWVSQAHNLKPLSSALLHPGKSLFVRTQAFTKNQLASIAGIDAVEIASLTGASMKPVAPGALRTANHRNGWASGGDLELLWEYATPDKPLTGAGLQDFGSPFVHVPAEGSFLVSFSDVSKTVVYTASDDHSFTYSAAARAADFPGETELAVALVHIDGVLSSDPATLTVQEL